MAKTHEDRIQDEVRRRMVDMARSAGIDSGRIELEVLFLLPTEFVRTYVELFYMALDDPVATRGMGKDEGQIKASGKPRDPMRARETSTAKPAKKFVAGRWPVRSEEAMEAKRRLDKAIVKASHAAIRAAGGRREFVPSKQPEQCGNCGRFQQEDWQRCPFHEE